MLPSISIYYIHVFYFKRFNSISLKLLSADGMFIFMRPSSLGGGRILRRTLSVRLSVCLSARPVRGSSFCFCLLFYSRTVLRANIQNRKTSVFASGPASRMYFSSRTEGRISYGHLGRTNLFDCMMCLSCPPLALCDIFHTPVALYSLFLLKVSLYSN